MLGLRLGKSARALITTTPRPIALLRGRTGDNDALEQDYLDDVRMRYRGTRLERQELDGELIEDFAGALWTRDVVSKCRVEMGDGMGTVTFPHGGAARGTVTFPRGGDHSGHCLGKGNCPPTITRVVVGVDRERL